MPGAQAPGKQLRKADEPAKRAAAFTIALSPAPRAQFVLLMANLGLAPQALFCRPLRGLGVQPLADYARRYCVVQDVSSITNEVANDESSTPRK